MTMNTLDQRVLALARAQGLLDPNLELAPPERPVEGEQTLWSPALQSLVDQGLLKAEDLDRLMLEALMLGAQDSGPATAFPSAWVESGLGRDAGLDLDDVQIERLGAYRDLTLIGVGGQGRVYRAFDEHLERWVALKLLPPDRAGAHLEEGRTQAKVDHPNICKVFEVGEAPRPDGALQPYIAMQLVQGRTLAHANLARDLIVALMRDVAEGVHAAHRLGLVHLDIKPGNILLENHEQSEPHPYVTDFGLLSGKGMIGTPPYCAPEQVSASLNAPDRRSDVYGLGSTLYVLLSGAFPFNAANLSELLKKIQSDEPEPLHQRVSGFPKDLSTIVSKAMAKDPSQRYATALALADDLQRYLDGESISARPSSRLDRAVKWVKRNRGVAGFALLAVVCFLVFGGLALRSAWRSHAESVAATQLGAEANNFGSIMRTAYLSPHHDLRPEIHMVRKRMEEIRNTYKKVGTGPAAYALARGHLALGELEAARVEFGRAWDQGYRTPDLAWNYGRVLGFLFQEKSRLADQALDPEKRKKALVELRKALLDPALEKLERGKTPSPRDAQLIAALKAEFERRDADVVSLTSQISQESASEYQSLSLQAYRLNTLANEQSGIVALKTLASSKELLNHALEIGRSDPYLHQYLVRCLYLQAAMEERSNGKIAPATIDELDHASLRFLALNPDDIGACMGRCDALLVKSRVANMAGVDASPFLREVISLGEKIANAKNPLDRTRGFELIASACEEMRYLPNLSVEDRKRTLLKGREACQSAIQLEARGTNAYVFLIEFLVDLSKHPDFDTKAQTLFIDEALEKAHQALDNKVNPLTTHQAAGLAYKRKAELLSAAGEDSGPMLRQARDHLETALNLAPKDPAAQNLLAQGLLDLGAYEIDHRNDPTVLIDRAQQLLRPLVQMIPKDLDAQTNLIQASYLKGLWLEAQGKDPSSAVVEGLLLTRKARANLPPSALMPTFSEVLFKVMQARWRVSIKQSPLSLLSEADYLMGKLVKANVSASGLFFAKAESIRLHLLWNEEPSKPSMKLLDEGLMHADRAVQLDPTDVDARLVRARLIQVKLRFLQGTDRVLEFKKAQADLERYLKTRPKDPAALGLQSVLPPK
jgi:eukaryotic-like serine/threonine-protein kinase